MTKRFVENHRRKSADMAVPGYELEYIRRHNDTAHRKRLKEKKKEGETSGRLRIAVVESIAR